MVRSFGYRQRRGRKMHGYYDGKKDLDDWIFDEDDGLPSNR